MDTQVQLVPMTWVKGQKTNLTGRSLVLSEAALRQALKEVGGGVEH